MESSILRRVALLTAITLLTAVPVARRETPAVPAASSSTSHVTPAVRETVAREIAAVAFAPNAGQWEEPVRYAAELGSGTLGLLDRGWNLTLRAASRTPRMGPSGREEPGTPMLDSTSARVAMSFAGDTRIPRLTGDERLPGTNSYFTGNDRSRWRTDVQRFAAVTYSGLYDGVDARVYTKDGHFEYDIVLAAGADLHAVEVEVDGARSMSIDASGALVLDTPLGPVTQPPPIAFAKAGPQASEPVTCAYELRGPRRFGFTAPGWDGRHPLEVDPGLVYSGLFGEAIFGVAVQSNGIITASTLSGTIYRIDPTRPVGQQLVWVGALGGGGLQIWNLFVEPAGRLTVCGRTGSPFFPTTPGAFAPNFNDIEDVVIAQIDPSLPGPQQLVWATYLGGSGMDWGGYGVYVSSSGIVTISGATESVDFPVTPNAFDTSNGLGGQFGDGFVAQFDPTLTGSQQLVYSTFVGGSGSDTVNSLHVGALITLVGSTVSTDFPVTANAYQTALQGGWDGFIAQIDPSLPAASQLVFGTYFGGSNDDGPNSRAPCPVDSQGVVTIGGETYSTDFPTTPNAYGSTSPGGGDVFLARINPNGPQSGRLSYSTLLGGPQRDYTYAVATNQAGDIVATGYTDSPTFPVTPGAYDTTFNGGGDGFVLKLSPTLPPSQQLTHSTFLGGSDWDEPQDIAITVNGDAVVGGRTFSSDFPVVGGSSGFGGGFVSIVALASPANPAPTVTGFTPPLMTAGNPTNTLTINGNGFVAASQVRWNATTLQLVSQTASTLVATLPPALVAAGTAATIVVTNPPPGGGSSSPKVFYVMNPPPALTAITPTSTIIGAGPVTVTVTGAGFNPSTQVLLSGTVLVPTNVTPTSMQVVVADTPGSPPTTESIAVRNPVPMGGTTATLPFVRNNPVPTLTSVNPTAVTLPTAFPALTVTGSNFVPSSRIRWNGATLTTTFVNSTTLTSAAGAGPQLSTPGAGDVTVQNPSPGGGITAPMTIDLNNPVPVISSLTQPAVVSESPGFTLRINGTGFRPNLMVDFGRAMRVPTSISPTLVTLDLGAVDLKAAATKSVRVVNVPGGASNTVMFTIYNPTPGINALSPSIVTEPGGGFTLRVTGGPFRPSSVIQLNGNAMPTLASTYYASISELRAVVAPFTFVTPVQYSVTAYTPGPYAPGLPPGPATGTSAPRPLAVLEPPPTLLGLSPSACYVGLPSLEVVLGGSGFTSHSIVYLDNVDITPPPPPPAQVDPARIRITLPASVLASSGTHQFRVVNPPLGGGVSQTVGFTVFNPVPTLASISPASVLPWSGPFTLTATGTGFNGSSRLSWTTPAGSTALLFPSNVTPTSFTVNVPPAFIDLASSAQIKVRNIQPAGYPPSDSPSLSLVFNNPVPHITGLTPSSIVAGTPGTTVVIAGDGFNLSSTARIWAGSAWIPLGIAGRTPTALSVVLPPSFLATPGVRGLSVLNPAPGGGGTPTTSFTVAAPVPTLATISPSSLNAGTPPTSVVLVGTGFYPNSRVRLDGHLVATSQTTYLDATHLAVVLSAADVPVSGNHELRVWTPSPGGGDSDPAILAVGRPSITSIQPALISLMTPTSLPVTLSIQGVGLGASSRVYANGVLLPSTYNAVSHTRNAQLGPGVPQTQLPGGIAIAFENPGGPTTPAIAVEVTNHANQGTIQRNPCVPQPGATYSLAIEGCPVGSAFTLFADASNPTPITAYPSPAADLVLAVNTLAANVLIDGLGLFGPPPSVPLTFAADAGVVAPHGAIRISGWTAPASGAGVPMTLQAYYPDPTSPVGYRLTHAHYPMDR